MITFSVGGFYWSFPWNILEFYSKFQYKQGPSEFLKFDFKFSLKRLEISFLQLS